jgi:hypothetical protein
MVWTLVGEVQFDTSTDAIELGPIVVPSEGGLSIKVSAPDPSAIPYGYSLLSFRSSYGEELGRIQVWPRVDPCVYRLGEGMKVRDPHGVLVFEPKGFSRRWASTVYPQAVRILADLPDPSLSDSLTPPGFADPAGVELSFTTAGGAARIAFPP